MPYWITNSLIATPTFLLVYIGLGLPWALALLPREDWPDRPLLFAMAFAAGPALLTGWMFMIGSFGILRLDSTLAGTIALAVVGVWLAWHKGKSTAPRPKLIPLTSLEWTLIVLIMAALVIRWLVVAYWPFTAYDALWVYGYEGRLYTLAGGIPAYIDYYPQFLPLQYTYAQLFTGVSDHAARAVLPLLHLGSVLAAFSLGKRLFDRRTGFVLAGLWTLYPAVGAWARMGDLEIPLTFLLTLATVFFFAAWNGQRPRHNASLAGLVYGIALWTKPTAGAFALGVALITAADLIRVRFDWHAWWPRLRVALLTAACCIPLGGVWYLRNVLLGHNAIDFPPEYWYTLAERGGGQLLWLLAGAIAAVIALWPTLSRRGHVLGAIALFLAGILPSALARFFEVPPSWVLWFFPSLDGLPRLGIFEWVLIIAGMGLLVWGARERIRIGLQNPSIALVAWMLMLAAPYFVVYFWRYSYHVRLSFSIVPILMLPVAILASRMRGAWVAPLAVTLALPGLIAPLYDSFVGWDWLWGGELTDDRAKLISGNDALMWMVDGFEKYEAENGEPPSIVAPGVQRLPFFFPTATIDYEHTPHDLSALDGITYFVDSHPDGTGAYENAGIDPAENQILRALGREDIMRRAWWRDDGIFRYEIYELYTGARYTEPPVVNPTNGEVLFGDFARFLGNDLGNSTFQLGERVVFKMMWEVISQPERDYMTYIHLKDADGNLQQAWDGPTAQTENGAYYTTLVWEPGEFIIDERDLRLHNEEAPPGDGYTLTIGLYDLVTGERVPITVDGEPNGDGYPLDENITVVIP